MKRLTLCAAMVLAFGWGESPASAEQCLAQSTPPTYTAGMAVPQVCDTHGTQKVMTVDENGNYVAGGGGGGGDASGLTHFDAADASTNSTAVLAAAGTVYHYSLSNTTTTVYYLRMYNSASAPTCSSATGFVESIPIPPASAAGQVGGRERIMNIGQAFTTGIAYCITASSGSTANDAAAAGVFVTLLYKAN